MAKIKKPKQNNQDIYFHLPGMFTFHRGYRTLLTFLKDRPEVLKENVKIGSIYGSPKCIWNGGRLIDESFSQELLEDISFFMENMKIPVRFTFTNPLITDEHLNDVFGNVILKIFNQKNNEILCNTEVLENYIRKNYDYSYISSTTKRLDSKELQNKELKKDKYKLIVLDYDYNKDFEYLKGIKQKEKSEILCNPVCNPKCKNRKEHYENIGYCQLYNSEKLMVCEDAAKPFWLVQKNINFISSEDIQNIYVPMGYSNFKLEGRTTIPIDWVEIILHYLIKEKYHPEVRFLLQIAFN